jgi:two-component system CheB/CheR fusion protein
MVTSAPEAAPPDTRPAVVAVCASAASPESLLHLLRTLAPQPDMALVIVLQHREALDAEAFTQALREAGHVPSPVAHDAPLVAGKTYLPDPDVIVSLKGGRFRVQPAEQRPGARGTIDSFLVALASDEEAYSIVAILAGTGADGTLGFKAVKEAGGLTLAEETEESRSSELAGSNHPTALADAVLPIDRLAERIKDGIRQIQAGAEFARPDAADNAATLGSIAAVLRKRTGHDFHGYKPGTFLRRVQRRMQVVQVSSAAAYLELLRERPSEAQELFNDLLIGVTQFFRDPHEFELLAREVVPKLFAGKTQNDRIRVWVIGCSTGEEAYSLGILLREHMATLDEVPLVQIFATDLDGRALAAARAARYAHTIADDMSPERLARWFVKEGNTYCVVKELREMCIFSQHSIIKDAPFSRLDIVSCRNLLIYLDAELQNQVIPLFHFALKPSGVLFLGNSENVSRHTNLFAPLEPRSRVFRRLEASNRVPPNFPFTVASLPPERLPVRSVAPSTIEPSLAQRAERFAERYAPAYVILDDGYNVLHFSARTGRYLDPVGGAATLNLLQLIHPDLRLDVREALSRAAEVEETVELADRRIGVNGHSLLVDLVVEPVKHASGPVRSYFVLFKDGHAAPGPGQIAVPTASSDQQAYIQQLEAELRETRERLQATAEEAETTSEELKASNEEYQSLNEELQSANEELQTSKEELQSLNEELTTVNGELSLRVQELGRSNSDLKNFLESTQIATIFLDNHLRVTNYTPAVAEIFHLVETDTGRPIGHIKSRLAYEDLQADARQVLRTLAAVEREIESATGARYMVRILPYRSVDNFIAGVVITFVDITARKQAETALRESQERFRLVVENARDHAIFTTDPGNRITDWYPSAEAVFGWTADEAIGQPGSILYTPSDRRQHADEKELEEARREGSAPNIRWHLRKDGARVFIEGTTRALHHADGSLRGFLKIGQDTTNRRETHEALRASETRQRALIEGIPQLVWRSADDGQWTWGSPQWLSFTGQTQEESVGMGWLDAVHPDDHNAALEAWDRAGLDGVLNVEYRVRRAADGAWLWHHTRSLPVRDAAGHTVEWLGTSTDIDAIRQLQARQEVLVNELQHRARNLLGVVSAVADRTVRQGGSVEAFEERLQALSRAQGLLSQGGHDTVAVGTLVRAELAAYTDEASPVVVIEGPEVRLKARQVQNFALALHELTTNAVKYGALKDGSGRLSVTWDVAQDAQARGRLALSWIESGVAVPQGVAPRRGYGTELIQEALAYALQADVEYVLEPGGVRCRIEMPVS